MSFMKKSREEKKEDSDEDVDVILERVKSYEEPMLTKSLEQGRSVSFKGLMEASDLLDDKQDSGKTHTELLNKIQRLTKELKQAEIDVSGEKAIRKKKEKTLMKLAKELKKRNEQRDEDVERLGELEESNKDLDHKLLLAVKELKQSKALSEKHLRESKMEYDGALSDAQEKYSRTCGEHDARITDLSKSHANQCEDLCREILKANLEADRLQSKLGTTDGSRKERTATPFSSKPKRNSFDASSLYPVLSVIVLGLAIVGYKLDIFTENGVCAPIMPGRVLNNNSKDASFEAPWWAPSPIKEKAFSQFCGSAHPTKLEWINEASENKVVLTKKGKTSLNKRTKSLEVFADRIRLWNRKGHAEEYAL